MSTVCFPVYPVSNFDAVQQGGVQLICDSFPNCTFLNSLLDNHFGTKALVLLDDKTFSKLTDDYMTDSFCEMEINFIVANKETNITQIIAKFRPNVILASFYEENIWFNENYFYNKTMKNNTLSQQFFIWVSLESLNRKLLLSDIAYNLIPISQKGNRRRPREIRKDSEIGFLQNRTLIITSNVPVSCMTIHFIPCLFHTLQGTSCTKFVTSQISF